jgi:glycosyltransferase involved in cell wall biosynthesis
MKPLVSVIIPTYNEENVIGDCIKSLQRQTYAPIEIIVVDDGSTDQTVNIVNKLDLKLIQQKHEGPGPARNLGVKHAKGKIIAFLDSDMTFEKDFLDRLTLPIREGKAKGTFSQEEFVSNWDNVWSRCWNWNNGSKGRERVGESIHDKEDFRAIDALLFKKSGGFDAVGYTDSRTIVKKLGIQPFPAPGAIYYHKNPGNLDEVFTQAKWIGRRKMKHGIIGQIINLLKYIALFSLFKGVVIALNNKEWRFLIFKIIYDLGFSIGIWTNILFRKTSR